MHTCTNEYTRTCTYLNALVHNISNVNNIEGNEKLSKIITEIRTVSGNYFQKQQTNRFKPNRNKLYLNKLQKAKSIVILKSDKGNSLVVLDTEKYFLFGHKFFNGDNFISCKNENEQKFNQLHLYLNKLLKEGKIDKQFQKTSEPTTFRTPVAYFLPKTHKSDFAQNLKYRPIISSYN